MTLAALADLGDLAARNITFPDEMDPDAVLGAASDAVRDAAGCAISLTTSTVTLVVRDWSAIDLPAGPVSAVSAVSVAGVPVLGWSKLGDSLVMPCGWTRTLPVEVQITYTHGYPVVPGDITDLVCAMAAMAFAASGQYGQNSRLAYVRLGDYGEGFKTASPTDSPSPLAIPESVRQSLRARFGTSVGVVSVH